MLTRCIFFCIMRRAIVTDSQWSFGIRIQIFFHLRNSAALVPFCANVRYFHNFSRVFAFFLIV